MPFPHPNKQALFKYGKDHSRALGASAERTGKLQEECIQGQIHKQDRTIFLSEL